MIEGKLNKNKNKPKQIDNIKNKYKAFIISFDGIKQFLHTNANYDLPNQTEVDYKNIQEVQHKNEDEFNLAGINTETRKLNIHNVFELISK